MILHKSAIERLCMRHVELSAFSTYGIGGKANYLAMPETSEDLADLLQDCKLRGMPWYIFGMGSNILFPDEPEHDLVFISLKNLVDLRVTNGKWHVSSGTPMSLLSLMGLMGRHDLLDFTFLLPGCLGAGIYMNAKYNHRQICDILDTVYYIDTMEPGLHIQSVAVSDCQFAYKQSIFQQHPWIVVGADLNIPVSSEEQVLSTAQLLKDWKSRGSHPSSLPSFFSFFLGEVHALAGQGIPTPQSMLDIIKYRTSKRHFDYPSCGSVFKNNYNYGVAVGALVDQLNIKGTEYGGAIISPHHGNMILNQNQAKASDIRYLMNLISESIDRQFGFVPEPEIVLV
ncbi:UDP-N-acetylmuramate dehydrogenase [Paenibacillus sp. JCM 10914]|uniref:UDP-N-acetylmuramate dehydrogenase n=1 Tax=Paenibacillus sp. JCM 10914 TaxID=1236974 RepID=UPI0005604DDF|nr:FAD-binding protein [Paenibacillus sp. JCM 10914]